MELKIRFLINLIQLDIFFSVSSRMIKGFADFLSDRTAVLRSFCRIAELSLGQVYLFWHSTGKRYIYNLVTKEGFCDKPDISTLSESLEAMRNHASTDGVSTTAMPKNGSGLDQMILQELVIILRDIFAYACVEIVVYALEENGVHAMSAEGDAEFYAGDKRERYREQFSSKTAN